MSDFDDHALDGYYPYWEEDEKQTMSDTTIDAIITKLRAGKDPDTGELHITEQEAKSALYELMLGVIGADEKRTLIEYYEGEPVTSDFIQNRLRAEQRTKLKGLFK